MEFLTTGSLSSVLRVKLLATLREGLCKTAQADLVPRIFASDLELTGESCRAEAV